MARNIPARRMGNTYRMVLRALLAASAKPDITVVIVVPSDSVANYTFNTLHYVAEALGDFVTGVLHQRVIKFGNGSKVEIIVVGSVGIRTHGRDVLILKDY